MRSAYVLLGLVKLAALQISRGEEQSTNADVVFNYPNGRPGRPNGRPGRPNGRPGRPNDRPGRPNRLAGYPNDVLRCSNGLPGVEAGNICCKEMCGSCGGPGCSSRPGGQDACCTSNIEDSGAACDKTGQAPCIINVCSDGVPGVDDDNICCEAQCVTCGGVGCSDRPGGEDACCTSNIEDSGISCTTSKEAPCIIDLCSNGVPGVEDGNICCEAECGTCGGPGCSGRPGGEDACCTSNIEDSGVACDTTGESPCIINVCSNGVPGVEDDNICCEAQCGTCGGVGCSDRPGGEDACCSNDIEASGIMCSATFEAPCIEDLCSNGVPGVQAGDVCCATQCGSCGGSGCSSRPGGQDACCQGNIRDDGVMCSTTSKAPCIIDAVMEQT